MFTTLDYYICIIYLILLSIFIVSIIPYFSKNYSHDLYKTVIKYIDDQKITFCAFAILVGVLILLLLRSYIYPINTDDSNETKQNSTHSQNTDFYQPTDSRTVDKTPLPPISNEKIKAIQNTLQPIDISTPVQQGGIYDFSR